jgi:competence protein ComEC
VKKYLLFYIFLFILLTFRFFFAFNHAHPYRDQQHVVFSSTVNQEPEIITGKQYFKIKTPDGISVKISTGLIPVIHFGDKLFIDGVFTRKSYQGHDYWVMYFPKIQINHKDQNIITDTASEIRKKAKMLSDSTLPPVSSSLLTGIIFGGSQGIPDEFMQKLRVVGVLHIIAASGMNVNLVAGALLFVLGTFLRRQIALLIAVLGVVFYVFLTGFEASIIRAAIMAVIAFSASLLGRQNIALLSVFLTGYIMLFFMPFLLFDVGFQLSFLSTLGILLIKPLIAIKGLRILRGIWDDVGTTIAAQIATMPILFGVFGSYGILSVLVNALVLWTIPPLMSLGSLAVLAGFICEPFGKMMLYLIYPLLWYFEKIILVFGGYGWMLSVSSLSTFFVVGYYLIVGSILLILQRRKREMEKREEKNG